MPKPNEQTPKPDAAAAAPAEPAEPEVTEVPEEVAEVVEQHEHADPLEAFVNKMTGDLAHVNERLDALEKKGKVTNDGTNHQAAPRKTTSVKAAPKSGGAEDHPADGGTEPAPKPDPKPVRKSGIRLFRTF